MGSLEEVKSELIDLLPRLQRYARNLSFSDSDADELVQATCLRVLEKHHQYRRGSNFDRWAFTVMSSVRNNHLRSLKHQESLSETQETIPGTADTETDTYHTQVLGLVQNLNVTHKQVMLLVYMEGFSYQEAADILNVPIGTVMSRIARARTKLAAYLSQEATQ